MFSFIRLMLSAVICFGLYMCGKRFTKFKRRTLVIVSFVLFYLVSTVLAFVPIEDSFVTFSSPEEAFKYYYPKTLNVVVVAEGEESAYVVGRESNRFTYLTIPKGDDGWKTGLGFYTHMIHNSLENNVCIEIYQHRDSGDYYIKVLDAVNGDAVVSDSCGSEFYCVEDKNEVSSVSFYVAHIDDFTYDYSVIVNGCQFLIQQ